MDGWSKRPGNKVSFPTRNARGQGLLWRCIDRYRPSVPRVLPHCICTDQFCAILVLTIFFVRLRNILCTLQVLRNMPPNPKVNPKQATQVENWEARGNFRKNQESVLRWCLYASQVAHHAWAYPGFSNMMRLGVFLFLPWWNTSPSQGWIRRYPFMHLGGGRHCESKVSCPRTQHYVPWPGLKPRPLAPESSALTTRPPRLPQMVYDYMVIFSLWVPWILVQSSFHWL